MAALRRGRWGLVRGRGNVLALVLAECVLCLLGKADCLPLSTGGSPRLPWIVTVDQEPI